MLILVCLFVRCSSFWRTWLSGWYLISPSLPLSKIITWCRQLQLLHSVWDIGEWSRHRCTPGGYTLAPSSEKKKQNQIIISIIVCCFFWPRNNMNTFLQWWGSSWHPILWEKREGRIKMQTWRGQQLREQTPEIDLKCPKSFRPPIPFISFPIKTCLKEKLELRTMYHFHPLK